MRSDSYRGTVPTNPCLPHCHTGQRMRWAITVSAVLALATAVSAAHTSVKNVYKASGALGAKPCRVGRTEGRCMFVWECINAGGTHAGVCVDQFMFGTCCANTSNSAAEKQPASSSMVPELFPPPKRPTTPSPFVTSPSRPPHPPSIVTAASLTTATTWTQVSSSNHGIITAAGTLTLKPQAASSHVAPVTQKPTDLSVYTNRPNFVTKPIKPSSQTTESWNKPWHNEVDSPSDGWSSASWHTTTFVTKPRPPNKRPPSTHRPVALTSVTSKPWTTSMTTTKRPTTTKPTTTRPTTRTTTTKPTTTTTRPSTTYRPSLSANSAKSQCGISQLHVRPEVRIVGGKNAQFGDWPWQVSVRRTSFFGLSSTHRCGGALINEKWVATAGHCVDDLLLSQIRVRVGEYDFSSAEEPLPFAERGAARKVVHPNYNFFTYEFDLALVRMDSGVEFAPHIAPICLPGSDDLLIGENATVTGWGRLSDGGTLPSVLQEVTVPILSNERCKYLFLRAGRHEFFPDIFMCAGFADGGRDACQGDSGGPLQVRGKDGRYFLAGIISWGIGCAEANLPGVCTRISKFVPWILDTVK